MLPYDRELKDRARRLRAEMTPAELRLWRRLRREALGVRFLRQKPIGRYIVDFYAPAAGLVIELDGGQHWETDATERDASRDEALRAFGLRVVRFSNLAVERSLEAVLGVIVEALRDVEGEGFPARCRPTSSSRLEGP